mmetsp:Transcript_42511/g.99590  ORF Transcript_42511/g.99590 Transcript_42511/m.99590 type:complete len:208 (-) Transcript_42511:734-1357(-)
MAPASAPAPAGAAIAADFASAGDSNAAGGVAARGFSAFGMRKVGIGLGPALCESGGCSPLIRRPAIISLRPLGFVAASFPAPASFAAPASEPFVSSLGASLRASPSAATAVRPTADAPSRTPSYGSPSGDAPLPSAPLAGGLGAAGAAPLLAGAQLRLSWRSFSCLRLRLSSAFIRLSSASSGSPSRGQSVTSSLCTVFRLPGGSLK